MYEDRRQHCILSKTPHEESVVVEEGMIHVAHSLLLLSPWQPQAI